jgi:hypothetical protein
MHFVGELHPAEFCPDLISGKPLEVISGNRANLNRD